uniref:Uncharacterized protein n=1 Tax=Anguilla anguilla TaxID=7936 RepID=A0A0E9X146_ANGAN
MKIHFSICELVALHNQVSVQKKKSHPTHLVTSLKQRGYIFRY